MISARILGSLLATVMVLPVAMAQSSSDCTCPTAGSVVTTTIFYDPLTLGSTAGGTATGTGAGGTSLGGTSVGGTVASTATGATSTGSNPNVPSVAAAIRAITEQSRALQSPASSLTTTNGPLIAIGQGPLPGIIAGFANIVTTATQALPAFQNLGTVSAGPDADLIFDVFREFVAVHQALLNILIGKAGLFSTVPIVGQPVAAALRSIEGVVDTVALALINGVQSQADNLRSQATSLDGTLTTAVNSYQGANTSNAVKL